jgi:hypothetical protein
MKKTVSLNDCYAPRDAQVLTRQVANEMVLVDVHNGVYHGLNPVAVQIWQQLDGQKPARTIVDSLSNQFPEIDPAIIQNDTLALLQSLLDHDLVVAR